jgi:hypothetical protein
MFYKTGNLINDFYIVFCNCCMNKNFIKMFNLFPGNMIAFQPRQNAHMDWWEPPSNSSNEIKNEIANGFQNVFYCK